MGATIHGHADLDIPVERLQAIGQEVAETGIGEWGDDDGTPRMVILDYQWGEIGTNIMVRRLSAAQFHVVFLTSAEMRAIAREEK